MPDVVYHLDFTGVTGNLVSSGYANDPVLANYIEYGFNGAIPKPFTLKELGRALAQALSG